jgi:hypothetical protein
MNDTKPDLDASANGDQHSATTRAIVVRRHRSANNIE